MRLIPHFSTVALVVVDTVRINLTSVSYRRFSSNYFPIADDTSTIDVQEFTRFRFLLNPRQRSRARNTKSPSFPPPHWTTGGAQMVAEAARRLLLCNSRFYTNDPGQ